jgi:hypothetical protein
MEIVACSIIFFQNSFAEVLHVPLKVDRGWNDNIQHTINLEKIH